MTQKNGILTCGVAALLCTSAVLAGPGEKERVSRNALTGPSGPTDAAWKMAFKATGVGGPVCATAQAIQFPNQVGNGASGTTGATSDLNVSAGFSVADNFEPTIDASIVDICWWGFYSNFGTPPQCAPTGDDFTVTYYLDASGAVGPVHAGPFTVASLAAGPTGLTITTGGGDFDEYSYTGSHPAVAVTAGTCYWISITNTTTADCLWLWSTSPDGDANSAQDAGGGFTPSDYDLAFGLDILFGVGSCPAPPAPANDDCGLAVVVTDGVTNYTNVGASASVGLDGLLAGECDNGFLGDGDIGSDVWFAYQATCTGELLVTTCGTVNYDSKMAVYSDGLNCPTDNTNLIGCADDDELGNTGNCPGFSTFLPNVPVVAGEWYLIRIGGYNGDQGIGSFELTCGLAGVGRCCVEAGGPVCYTDVTGPAGPGNGDGNVDALDFLLQVAEWGSPCNPAPPNNPGDPCFSDVTSPAGAGISDSNVDALERLLLVAEWGSPCNPAPGPVGPSCSEELEPDCIALGGTWQANTTCATACPLNSEGDECDDPIILGELTAGVTVSDSPIISVDGYSTNATDPVETCEAAGDPLNPFAKEANWWYEFTVPAGCTSVTVTECNTVPDTQDTIITLWEGDCGALIELACDDDTCTAPGFGASVFTYNGVVAGTTYRIFVNVYSGGTLDVNSPIRTDVTCN